MAKRKTISKKARFEVFKRDGFTCQYCGAKAPDVVLHVDHISPVSKGGGNDILNLITSCAACNGGKGARTLDDNTVLAKQREQLAEINERREQLRLMVEWREQLVAIGDQGAIAAAHHFERLIGGDRQVTDSGLADLKKLVRKYGLPVVLDAIETSVGRHDDVWIAFKKIGAICGYKSLPKEVQEQRYIFGILRNRVDLSDPDEATEVVNSIQTITSIVGAEVAREFAKKVDDIGDWHNFVLEQEYLAAKEQGYA